MSQLAYDDETLWLRDFLKHGCPDVFFPTEVDEDLRAAKLSRPDLWAFLKVAPVTYSERIDTGWLWVIEGENSEGDHMVVQLEVETNIMRVEVLSVMTSN